MTLVDDEVAARAVALFGDRARVHGEKAASFALSALVDAERARRGDPDPVSGAFHGLFLTQGALLKAEYDLSTHGHYAGWEIGAVVADVKHLIRVNQEHGFGSGDEVLRATATALSAAFPTAKVVRIHSDAFAALLPPSAEVTIDAALELRAHKALQGELAKLSARLGPIEHTLSVLHLILERPSHWQVLGPLVWAECERTHVQAIRGEATGVQRRRIVLDAAV